MATIEFRVLGPVEVWREGIQLALGGPKRRALLALLLLRANEQIPAERLVHDLWGEAPPPTAANTLQVNVSQLRKTLGPDRIVGAAGGYRLRVEADELDLRRFTDAAAAGRGAFAAGDLTTAAAAFDEALSLWRGDAFEDLVTEPFATVEAARLDEQRLAIVEDRLETLLGLGRAGEVVADLEALLTAHPYRERLYRLLMLALYRTGRQADALLVYQRARATLADELGVAPSPPLRALEQAILTQDPQLETPRGSEPRPLPVPPTALVGRTLELHELQRLVERGVRLVTLSGPGGIGKTRLALEVARVTASSGRRAVFVPLADVADHALFAGATLEALGIPAGADAERSLLDELRERPRLLVLDNFEQVVSAAPTVARLLELLPDLVLLVTSREPLRIAGEHEFPVPPLSTADAVDLFLDRARAVAAEPTSTQDDDAAIRQICDRLEGLPLAIELAAARVRVLPPRALLSRLESRLDTLGGTRRDAPERQRTMRAAIEWSYRLLDADEQRLFARLGAFAGSASLEAVGAIVGDVATLDRLAALVDKSLIRQQGVDEPRFSMFEILREFAIEQLAELGENDEIRRRHLAYFAELVERADAALDGREQRTWLERLESDHANLRLAIANALELRDATRAVTIAAGLRLLWYVHGHAAEGLRVLDTVLAVADGAPASILTKAHNGAAMLASDCGDYVAVRRHLTRSLELAYELGDERHVGVAQLNLGNVALYEEKWEEAERLYEDALRIFRRRGDARREAMVLEDLALVALGRGDDARAVTLLEAAIERAGVAEAPHEIGSSRLDLARVLLLRGELERPRHLAAEAHEIFRALDARPRVADSLETIAAVAEADGKHEEAALLLGAAEALRRAIGAVRQPDHERWLQPIEARMRGVLGAAAFERAQDAGGVLDDDAIEALCARFR